MLLLLLRSAEFPTPFVNPAHTASRKPLVEEELGTKGVGPAPISAWQAAGSCGTPQSGVLVLQRVSGWLQCHQEWESEMRASQAEVWVAAVLPSHLCLCRRWHGVPMLGFCFHSQQLSACPFTQPLSWGSQPGSESSMLLSALD